MGNVPKTRLGKIEWYESHIAPWTANAVAIGLTAETVAALGSATENARSAYAAHLAARQSAEVATQNFYELVRTMHNAPGAGADMIQTIKTFAETTANPEVYTLAEIPPPASPSTVPPPALPTSFRVEIGQDGNLIIRWKASNPAGSAGTAYIVERRLNSAGAYAFLGAAGGDKTFDDTTIPAGTAQVDYRVRGQRSGVSGPAAVWTVRFGVGGGGGGLTIAAQFPGTDTGGGGEVKMAA
ncbi:MAG: hypothetical protein WD749_05765 [Phycisphaerales bacterium]